MRFSNRGIDLNACDTNMKDDLPWGVCDRMDGLLWEESSAAPKGIPVETDI